VSPSRKRKARRRHPAPERRWSVDDALREYAKLIRWYDGADGVREAYNTYRLHYGGVWPPSLPNEDARRRVAERTAQATATSMRTFDPVWCDPPMVDLLAAAADSYPLEPMRPEQLLAPDGMVIFAKPLPVVWRGDVDVEEHRLAAISWGESLATNDGRTFTSITAWHRYTGLWRDGSGESVRYVGLRPQSLSMGAPWIVPTDVGGPASPHRLLQAFSALVRLPLVRDEHGPVSKSARREGERAGLRDAAVRRAYLRRPEDAGEELEAALAARQAHPTRGHWVRGHWKQQWYPSVEEHRPLWVSGYPRGDFAAGTVSGVKVLVASSRDADSQRSAEPTSPVP
jgi:hypothetical protein